MTGFCAGAVEMRRFPRRKMDIRHEQFEPSCWREFSLTSMAFFILW